MSLELVANGDGLSIGTERRGEECNTCSQGNVDIKNCFCDSSFLHASFTVALIFSIRSVSTGYDSVSGTIWTGRRSVYTFVPVLQWVLTIRYIDLNCRGSSFHEHF